MIESETVRNIVLLAYEEAVMAVRGQNNSYRLRDLPLTGRVAFKVASRFRDNHGCVDETLDFSRGSIWTNEHPWYGAVSLAWKRDRCVGRWKLADVVLITNALLKLNAITAPGAVVLGEGGSWVPIHSSRVMPDGSILRLLHGWQVLTLELANFDIDCRRDYRRAPSLQPALRSMRTQLR